MIYSLFWLIAISTLVLLTFWTWHRRPAGRNTRGPRRPQIKTMVDFDQANPKADKKVRNLFYKGVSAHLDGKLQEAETHYKNVLDKIGNNEPTTLHNLEEIKRVQRKSQ